VTGPASPFAPGRVGAGATVLEVAVEHAVETDRLVLRRWRAEDRAPLAEINADPEVMRWIGAGRVLGRGLSDDLIARSEREWDARGFGLWALTWRTHDGGRLLGFCGLTAPMFLPAVAPAAEIGWRLARDAWGRGVATEAARAALAFGFEACGLREVVAVVGPQNTRSLRVCTKLGMASRPDQWHAGMGGRVHVLGVGADGYNG
jgi:RimJ/RimL family protein N-acetyltransferase